MMLRYHARILDLGMTAQVLCLTGVTLQTATGQSAERAASACAPAVSARLATDLATVPF